jgi:hypothetical protein
MTAVVAATKVSVPTSYPVPSHQRIPNAPMPQLAASSRTKMPSSSSNISSSSTPSTKDGTSKPTFVRIRTSLEQSLRSAARSKKASAPTEDYFTMSGKGKEKEKERAKVDESPSKEKREGGGVLRRLESRVGFRRSGRESVTPSPSPMPPSPTPYSKREEKRLAGFTSFITPSLRQASMSSPALHLSSQALPSPKSQSVIPASSSAAADVIATPSREKPKRLSMQPPPKDPSMAIRVPSTPTRTTSGSKHRATKSQPLNVPSSTSATNLPLTPTRSSPITSNHRATDSRDIPSPPDTPTPSGSRSGGLTHSTSRSQSSTHLPISSPVQLVPRGSSPIRPRSPSRSRVVTPTGRLASSSTSHLPLTSSPSARRTSIDAQRRPSIDSPRRTSIDGARKVSEHLRGARDESPSPVRPRPTSPAQRSYAQNRHFNVSSGSLIAPPSNPEHREVIRKATSMLCKEVKKPPSHISRTVWEEVDIRMQNLGRLERMWDRGFTSSSTNLSTSATLGTGGEERERRLFAEALRDGYVLCQCVFTHSNSSSQLITFFRLMNKLRQSSIVKPDPKDDGFVRQGNVTRFLAACSSYGLSNNDLFQRDDLVEATSESLARVAKTIITLIKFVDTPTPDRSRIFGQKQSTSSGPYSPGVASRSASSSSPNLFSQRTISPSPSSPSRKRFNPSELPAVRADSPDETGGDITPSANTQERRHVGDNDRAVQDSPRIMPPPKSPLRTRSSRTNSNEESGYGLFTRPVNTSFEARASIADSTRASFGDGSIRESLNDSPTVRQSFASATTDTTNTTMLSSLLEVGRSTSSGVFNRFGTIRTMTTEATSEAPSRADDGSITTLDDGPRKRDVYTNGSVVDLTRVVEETEDGGGSSIRGEGAHGKEKGKAKVPSIEVVPEKVERPQLSPAIRLGKGKWPDDFMEVMQSHNHRTISISSRDQSSDPGHPSTPLSTSPPRKLAIVGANRRNESAESVSQLPRRPTTKARHSIDPVLIPKESRFRRDSSPDVPPSPSSRVVPRRHSSTKPAVPLLRTATLLPKEASENDSLVPFPSRGASGDHSSDDKSESDRPRLRGRFQSDVGGTKRRPRPSSYDELGVRPRSRFESMVNLGVGSSTASASDLMSNHSAEGSAVRKTITIKEDGKPPTHFVSLKLFQSLFLSFESNASTATGQLHWPWPVRLRLQGSESEYRTDGGGKAYSFGRTQGRRSHSAHAGS